MNKPQDMKVQTPVHSKWTSRGNHHLGYHAAGTQLAKWSSPGNYEQNAKISSKSNILQGYRDLEINIWKVSSPKEVKFGHELIKYTSKKST